MSKHIIDILTDEDSDDDDDDDIVLIRSRSSSNTMDRGTSTTLYSYTNSSSSLAFPLPPPVEGTPQKFKNSGLSDQSVSAYFLTLSDNLSDVIFDLSKGFLTTHGAAKAMEMIKQKRFKKVKLILDNNNIDDTIFNKLEKDINSSQLYCLSLANNKITNEGINFLKRSEGFLKLDELNLSGNKGISDSSLKNWGKVDIPRQKGRRHDHHSLEYNRDYDGMEQYWPIKLGQIRLNFSNTKVTCGIYINFLLTQTLVGQKLSDRVVEMTNYGLSDGHIPHILEHISQRSSDGPYTLDLSHNEITSKGANAIFEFIKTKDIFKVINLSGNQISDSCIPTFIDALILSKNLHEMYFGSETGGNLISDKGIKKFESIEDKETCLSILNLSQNKSITEKSESVFEKLKSSKIVANIGLWDTGMSKTASNKVEEKFNSDKTKLQNKTLQNKYINKNSNADLLKDIDELKKQVEMYSQDVNRFLNKHNELADIRVLDVEEHCKKLERDLAKVTSLQVSSSSNYSIIGVAEQRKQSDALRNSLIKDMLDMQELIGKYSVKVDIELNTIKQKEISLLSLLSAIEIELERIRGMNMLFMNTNAKHQNDEIYSSSSSSFLSSSLRNLKNSISSIGKEFSQFYDKFNKEIEPIQTMWIDTRLKLSKAISKKENNEKWIEMNKSRLSKLEEQIQLQQNFQKNQGLNRIVQNSHPSISFQETTAKIGSSSFQSSLSSLSASPSTSLNEPVQTIFHIPQAFKIRPRSYQIVDLVGNGGFSDVYKVRKVSDGSKDDFYAFKQFKIISLTDKESKSIANEVEILTSINHENIVSIKGLIGDPKSVDVIGKRLGVGLMMEYCENLSLRNALDKQPNLELSRIYKILSGVASGLKYLHLLDPNPIIHGDIKSDNVLIDSNWTAKLCDFGISKAITTITATRNASGGGTANYIAPEIHNGEEPESSSDIYSFGCLIFESLSGERPWQGLLPNVIITKLLVKKESMDYSKIRRDAPHKLSALMQKCLSYDKQHRPRIQEVNVDLETLLEPVLISELDRNSREYKTIQNMFFPSSSFPSSFFSSFANSQGTLNQNTFVIESIEKVQNDYTEKMYTGELQNVQRERKLTNAASGNPMFLFHGTKNNNPYMIAKHRHGLMKDYSADGFYGKGLYFAELARYSHNGYAFRVPNTNQYKMLVCSVICGKSDEKGILTDKTASHKTLAAKGFDSIHAGPHRPGAAGPGLDDSCMYVVYKDSQVTPRYIITYKQE